MTATIHLEHSAMNIRGFLGYKFQTTWIQEGKTRYKVGTTSLQAAGSVLAQSFPRKSRNGLERSVGLVSRSRLVFLSAQHRMNHTRNALFNGRFVP